MNREDLLFIGLLIFIIFLTSLVLIFELEAPIMYIIDGEVVSCDNERISNCGVWLSECDNRKEYKCVTNLIEVSIK